MKKFIHFLFSPYLMGFLLLGLGAAMAGATFIEHVRGTVIAHTVVYDAWWFELMIFLAAVNLTGNMIRYKSWKKFPVFLFHLAFLFILTGAAITRYISYEGTMHIREGSSSDQILSSDKWVYGHLTGPEGKKEEFSYKVTFLPGKRQTFHRTIILDSREVSLSFVRYMHHAQRRLVPSPQGSWWVRLVLLTSGERQELLLREGEKAYAEGKTIRFGEENEGEAFLRILRNGEKLLFVCSDPVYRVTMTSGGKRDTLTAGVPHPFERGNLYLTTSFEVVFKDLQGPARLEWTAATEGQGPPAVTFLVEHDTLRREVTLPEQVTRETNPAVVPLGDLTLHLAYGHRPIKLPFSLYLKDFQLERYPGSESPASYASEVVLIDPERNIRMPYRIYMNHTLKYRGYKFFQSSYDRDERGTILSVNHDMLGTTVTYIGYFLMTLGMVLAIFLRRGRFMQLARMTGVAGSKTVAAVFILLFGSLTPSHASEKNPVAPPVPPAETASTFSDVLVQDQGGRIKPFYTLASEIVRKVTQKERYRGLSPVQVVLGMYGHPHEWQHEPMISIPGEALPELLGIEGRKAAYTDFFDADRHFEYKLRKYVQEAYRRPPEARSKLDQDVMKLDERVNICYLVYSGRILRIFPAAGDPSHRWYGPGEAAGQVPREDSLFVSTVFGEWLDAADAGQTAKAAEIAGKIKAFQRTRGGDLIPSPGRIRMEILYERWEVFGRLTLWYALFGFILLGILFVRIVRRETPSGRYVRLFTWPLLLGFLAHTGGLAVRWYISGHAPWSNGYESMIYIAWAGMLAGLIFVKKSPFSLAAAAILSSLTLFVAHLSWMNPEITNLVPVLRSYWLTIHVSVITASYGFLGMGMIIGLLNLTFSLMKNDRNRRHISQQQEILTQVNEMALILGVYFLTIGTFLGGVWANESWGRYWGWDPKETWALITVLVYAFVVHMRLIPGLRGWFAFNVASVLAFFSVIMTYFGVNYYLTGLHSYAQGDRAPVPSMVFWLLGGLGLLILLAWYRERGLSKS